MDTFWLTLSAALAVGIPALATAWAQSKIGSSVAATLAEKPELSTTAILMIAIGVYPKLLSDMIQATISNLVRLIGA